MGKAIYGLGNECVLFAPVTVADTAAHIATIIDLRNKDVVALVLLAAGGAATLDGAWKIEVSNDYNRPQAGGAADGQASTTATWVDITASALWVDAIAAVAHGTASSTKQYVQPKYPVGARDMRITFTGSAGSATVAVYGFLKSLGG